MEQVIHKLRSFFGAFDWGVFDGRSCWPVPGRTKNLGYVRAMNAQGKNIFIRPVQEGRFMLADDLDKTRVLKHHSDGTNRYRPGRMIVETSPGNYQVWIRADREMEPAEKSYWLNRMGSDPGAAPRNRWGRAPGFRNRKDRHRDATGGYPLAKLVWIDFEAPAIVPPAPLPHLPRGGSVPLRAARKSAFLSVGRSDYETGDESRTDFRFALALARRGATDAEITARIEAERAEWGNHAGDNRRAAYLARTLRSVRNVLDATPAGKFRGVSTW